MKQGLQIPGSIGRDRVELATHAEEIGYDSIWLGELWGTNSPVQLSEIAKSTERVTLGTAILNVFSRTPATLAMTASSLHRISDGRFTMGLGTSTQTAIEDLHGMKFDRPVRRAHETIELVRKFLDGPQADGESSSKDQRVEYEGEILHTSNFTPLDIDVPIYHAALGPANCRVVARLCDGWLPHNIPFPKLGQKFEYIKKHAKKEGRDPDNITVAPYVPAAVDTDSQVARNAIRGHVGYYVGSGSGYKQAVASQFPESADRIAEKWGKGQHQEAIDLVTNEMVDALGVAGTPDEAREKLKSLTENTVIDHPIILLPAQANDELAENTIDSLAPNQL